MNKSWLFLASAIAITMLGQALLKAGAGRLSFVDQLLDWRTITGLALYGGSAILYIVALRRIPMSVAMPCTAASYVAAALIGHFVFGEPISRAMLGSIALISAGVGLLAFAGS